MASVVRWVWSAGVDGVLSVAQGVSDIGTVIGGLVLGDEAVEPRKQEPASRQLKISQAVQTMPEPISVPVSATLPMAQRTGDRVERYIDDVAEKSESHSPRCAGCLRVAACAMGCVMYLLMLLLTWVVRGCICLFGKCGTCCAKCPADVMDVSQMFTGLTIGFWGGNYYKLIQIWESFLKFGGQNALNITMEQVFIVMGALYEASLNDGGQSTNVDGNADEEQIAGKEVGVEKARKVKYPIFWLAMSALDPGKLQYAIASLWTGCIAGVLTVQFEFVQITAYALAIALMVKVSVLRICGPSVAWALGKDLKHWVDPIIDSGTKVFLIALLWYLAEMRAAIYSSLYGGQMFAEAWLRWAGYRGLMARPEPADPASESANTQPPPELPFDLDFEKAWYAMSAFGCCYQLAYHAPVPPSLEWLLIPAPQWEQWLEQQQN